VLARTWKYATAGLVVLLLAAALVVRRQRRSRGSVKNR
jgi:LPXTG-motif cell wall-anchored protein